MKKAAPAAHANLDGVASMEMPPMVRYLDEDGELLVEEQPMSDELALEGYRVMLRGRRFDERSVSLQRQGRMVTLAPGIGQEAATASLRASRAPVRPPLQRSQAVSSGQRTPRRDRHPRRRNPSLHPGFGLLKRRGRDLNPRHA